MKNAKIMKTITALVLSAALVASVAACSDKTEETTKAEETTTEATTEEETTTTEETTEATTEESESEEETSAEGDEAVTADTFQDEEVKAAAQEAIDNGLTIAMAIDAETAEMMEMNNVVEGFYATEAENPSSITIVVKFADIDAALAYVDAENEGLEESEQAKAVKQDDGSYVLEIPGADEAEGSATISATGLLTMVMSY